MWKSEHLLTDGSVCSEDYLSTAGYPILAPNTDSLTFKNTLYVRCALNVCITQHFFFTPGFSGSCHPILVLTFYRLINVCNLPLATAELKNNLSNYIRSQVPCQTMYLVTLGHRCLVKQNVSSYIRRYINQTFV